jgi:hypothetical protein
MEPMFLLMYHIGFSFVEAWNLPISWRKWFIGRINAENERKNEGSDNDQQSAGTPPPSDIRRLLDAGPVRRKRF